MSPSRSSRRGLAALVVVAAMVGCRSSNEVPPLAASSDVPVAGTEVVDDPVRTELRGLYAACEVRREALVQDLDHAERRYARISGAATIAWFVGQLLGGQAPPGPELTENECTAPDGAGVGTARCNPQTVVVAGRHESYDPAHQEVRTVALDGRQQLHAINRAIDETDTLLFGHPDVEAWTDAEWDRWYELRAALRVLCE